jgi:hypothetical protein
MHDGEKYDCSLCPKFFSRKDNLERHVRIIHPDITPDTPATPATPDTPATLDNTRCPIREGELQDGVDQIGMHRIPSPCTITSLSRRLI